MVVKADIRLHEFDESWGPLKEITWDGEAQAWYLTLRTDEHFPVTSSTKIPKGITIDLTPSGKIFGIEGL